MALTPIYRRNSSDVVVQIVVVFILVIVSVSLGMLISILRNNCCLEPANLQGKPGVIYGSPHRLRLEKDVYVPYGQDVPNGCVRLQSYYPFQSNSEIYQMYECYKR